MLVIFFASWINIVQKKILSGFFVVVVNVGIRHGFQRGSIEVLHRRGAQLIVLRLDIVACSSCSTSTGAPAIECHPGSCKVHCRNGFWFCESQVDSHAVVSGLSVSRAWRAKSWTI